MKEDSKLSLSFETYNTTAASGYVNISMQYNGKALSSGESGISYVTTNGMTCSRSGTGYKLSWNANYDERNEKVYTITITYKGESKSADIIQGKDYVLETNEVISVEQVHHNGIECDYSGNVSNFPMLHVSNNGYGIFVYTLVDEIKYKSGRTRYEHTGQYTEEQQFFLYGTIYPSKSGNTVSVNGALTIGSVTNSDIYSFLFIKTSQDNSEYTENRTFNFDIYNKEDNKIGSGQAYYYNNNRAAIFF